MLNINNQRINKEIDVKLYIRRICLIIMDSILIAIACMLALAFRFEFEIVDGLFRQYLTECLSLFIISSIIIFWLYRIYHSLWEYISAKEIKNIILASCSSGIAQMVIITMMDKRFPRSYYVLYIAFIAAFLGITRAAYRYIRLCKKKWNRSHLKQLQRVMIVGAGEAGMALLREIQNSEQLNYKVCCLVDGDKNKQGKYLRGVPVVGNRYDIVKNAEAYKIDKIFIALPKLSAKELKPILDICKQTDCEIQKVAGIYQLLNGEVSVSQLRKITIEDLLGRESIKVDLDKISGYLHGRVVMVTGGSGSIGSELCRQIINKKPKKLIILDIYENSTYILQRELMRTQPDLDFEVIIASVRDEERMRGIFERFHPEIIFHAAAYKHVPLMEACPNEAVKNNVLGTFNMVKLSDEYGVKRFIQISTDKAVNPTNIMGASKRICEMIIQSYNKRSKTEYVAVRFGNVLGSNGSVVPLFKQQIEEGGPITVTHPDIIRYFMTIPEAVSLVLMAGAYAKGGEIFVLDMGEPVKILELAQNMIRLAGLREGEDIEIEFIGLRPGEKLYEELLMSEEGMKSTENSMIYIGHPIEFDEDKLYSMLLQMKAEAENQSADMRQMVKEIVPTYVLPEDWRKLQF